MTLLRHLLSIVLLPFMVVIVIPLWLMGIDAHAATPLEGTAIGVVLMAFGGLSFIAGFALFVCCVVLFARVGRGTLAPWDPTRHLVVVGPYRHVRNPMISAVAMMLLGLAALHASWKLTLWFAAFMLTNHVYFLLSEEPGLVARFGGEYERYRASVPRWVPRARGWNGGA